MLELPVHVSLRIGAPVAETFRAWVDPDHASRWQCDRLEGRWAKDATATWIYGEDRQDLRVIAIDPGRRLEFTYCAYGTQPETRVRIEFVDLGTETGIKLEERMVAADLIADHACGWENMLCRLKVYLELGFEYDFSRGCFKSEPRV